MQVTYPADITPKQRRVLDAMVRCVETGEWDAIRGSTVRFTRVCTTSQIDLRRWPEPTYQQHVFVTLRTGPGGRVLLGVVLSPFSGRADTWVTLDRALAVLADPVAAALKPRAYQP